MIKVIHYQNESVERPFEPTIATSYDEVRGILPTLPETVKIYFSDDGIIPESGIGGYAYAHDIMTISIDPDYPNKEKQRKDIRPTVFHEAFHQQQNYTGESGPFSAIDNALYEGMATVFEREYCGVWEAYGDYRQTSSAALGQWMKQLRRMSIAEFDKSYDEWKFYHSKLKERWIIYRVGTWMTDQVLEKQGLGILDLSSKSAKEVLKLYDQ